MVLLNSEKHQLGSIAPDFNLPSVDGQNYSLSSFSSDVLVLMFICNHCPYVQAVEDRIIQLQRSNESKSVQLVGICSNDATDYPDDSPESLKAVWEEKDYRFPYLVDESQEMAKNYGVVCTPEFFVFDKDRKLVYHGQLDDNWKEPDKVTRHDLQDAVDAVLSGKEPSSEQVPSMGCSVKWKQGNA